MQSTIERLRARRDRLEGREGGFTLIELLIVIVILAILAAIVVFAVQNLSSTSAQASCTSDFKTVETAVEAYKSQMGSYPAGVTPAAALGTVSSSTVTNNGTPGVIGTGTNAAANNGILMTGSNVATSGAAKDTNGTATLNLNSPSGASVGPWLKTNPINGNHYSIAVSNDGKGTVQVDSVAGGVDSGAALTGNGAAAGTCAAVS
jgi:general secretion pathway protein G